MSKKERLYADILLLLAVIICMTTAFYFCNKKQGFHEDEYYSFYSTERTTGLFVEEDQWKPVDEIMQEFTILPGEGFRYGLVREVQSWDVHPPVYYWILHTVESLYPGVFEKWIGLSINLSAFVIGLFLLASLCGSLCKNKWITPMVVLLYGMTPAALSGVTFIRMYALLTVFVLWAAILHCDNLEKEQLSVVRFYVPLAICTYLGFLTQYYYFIFLFFAAAYFCLYRLVAKKKFKDVCAYGITMVITFLLCYITYPAFPGQMFKGQRGAQATASFFDIGNTFKRFAFFSGLIHRFVFCGLTIVFVILLLGYGAVLLYRWKKKDEKPALIGAPYRMLLCTVLGYFLVVSKTALLLGASSVRYMMPIYGIVILLLVVALSKQKRVVFIAAVVGLFICEVYSSFSGNVQFLYPEDKEQIAFAHRCVVNRMPAIYFYNNAQTWCVWDSTDELMEYPQVFFADQSKDEPIMDDVIAGMHHLVVYVSKLDDEQIAFDRLQKTNPHISTFEMQYEDTYCKVYLAK